MAQELPSACITIAHSPELETSLGEACLPQFVAASGVPGALAQAEGLLCPAPFPVGPALLDAAPRLRVIANFGVGFNNVDLADVTRRGIAVCNTPGVLNDAVAELTIGMILMASRRLPQNHAFVHSGAWSRGEARP